MPKGPRRRRDNTGSTNSPKAAQILEAAKSLAAAYARHRALRAELRACEGDMRRALALQKRLTAPPALPIRRPAYRYPPPAPAAPGSAD